MPSRGTAGAAGGPSASRRFDRAARDLWDSVQAGRASAVTPEDLRLISDWLAETLRRSYGFAESDAADASQDAILALLELAASESSQPAEVRNPAAYLTWLARNRAIDRLRSASWKALHAPEARIEPQGEHEDDAIARLLDRNATAVAVRDAMGAALDAQDHLAVRIVTIWLDLAAELGEPPSSRTVAERGGVSHTTVNQALRRFASYFPTSGPGTSKG